MAKQCPRPREFDIDGETWRYTDTKPTVWYAMPTQPAREDKEKTT